MHFPLKSNTVRTLGDRSLILVRPSSRICTNYAMWHLTYAKHQRCLPLLCLHFVSPSFFCLPGYKHKRLCVSLAVLPSCLKSSFLLCEMSLTGRRKVKISACTQDFATLCSRGITTNPVILLKWDQRWADSCQSVETFGDGWHFEIWNSWTAFWYL